MDLKDYDHAKFALAEILQSAVEAARAAEPDNPYPFEELFAALAEDRFNLAVIGQFSRGKTSLMNAMLGTERLPTGIVPLTSVITTVQYGPEERAVLEYEGRRFAEEIPLERLPDYVTQRGNPGNERGIRRARVELPSEILRRGFYLIDTPGLGSAIAENTRTTEAFLPEADAFILVTSYDSPLSDQEVELLERLLATGSKLFLIVNKEDLATPAERAEVIAHIRERLSDAPGLAVFSVSARDAMAANRRGDAQGLRDSGVSAFLDNLTQFLLTEKRAAFLKRMAGRVGERLAALGCTEGLVRLAALERTMFRGDAPISEIHPAYAVRRFASCLICAWVERDVRLFLQTWQYKVSLDRDTQAALARAGGLCPFHTWQYAAMASSHGTCAGFPPALEELAARLRAIGHAPPSDVPDRLHALVPGEARCVLCRVRARAEREAVDRAVRAVTEADGKPFPDLCLPHLAPVAAALGDHPARGALLERQAEALERVAEDMRRYALKRSALRRAFTTHDELDADLRGLVALGGYRNLHFTPWAR